MALIRPSRVCPPCTNIIIVVVVTIPGDVTQRERFLKKKNNLMLELPLVAEI